MSQSPIFLTVQWHLTARCGSRCRHCYVHSPATYGAELAGELDLPRALQVLDRLNELETGWNVRIPHVALSGGDPLLHPGWKELVRALGQRGTHVHLMGTPETIDDASVGTLAELGVARVQLSLDGLQPTHDSIRGAGSFARTLAALARLEAHRIPSSVMLTLSRDNAPDLIPLVRFLGRETSAGAFAFDLACAVGNAAGTTERLSPQEVREIFSAYLAAKHELEASGCRIQLHEKPHLFRLARYERGELHPVVTAGIPVQEGCHAGWRTITVLGDGTVLPCRRLPVPVGTLPEQPLGEIFFGSPLLRRLRRRESFAACGTCDLYQVCRGCPAVTASLEGDPFAPQPHCFRDRIGQPRAAGTERMATSPPLDVSNLEERGFVASQLTSRLAGRLGAFIEEAPFQEAFLDLLGSEAARARFLADPWAYAAAARRPLGDEQLAWLMWRFSRTLPPSSREQAAGEARLEAAIAHRARLRRYA